jgi:hypothetical protein
VGWQGGGMNKSSSLEIMYNQNMKTYYVYLHTRNDTGEVFYVGKGQGRRAWWKNGRNRHWHFLAQKHGYEVHIWCDELTEAQAFEIEKERISFYGRNNLCNYTDGGDGASGAKRTEAQKLHMKEKMTGRKFSNQTLEKMKLAASNRTEETRQKQANAIRGRRHTEEHKQKISTAGIGRMPTEETKKKISDAHKGKPKSIDAVKKMAKSKSKKVMCLTNSKIYESQSEAARQLNLKSSHISAVVNGKAHQTKGFVFVLVQS